MTQKDNDAKLEKQKKKIFSLLFISILFIFVVINLFTKDKAYSEKENRMLEQKPQFSISTMETGRFMDQYESYKSDQFFARDFWVSLKTNIDLLCGKRESNGVFKGKNYYLLEDIAEPNEESMSYNLDSMKSFQEKYSDIPMHIALVPNAANILADKLPAFAVTKNQNEYLDNIHNELNGFINWIDLSETLKEHSSEEIYYHTDHHWTTLGAYYSFQTIAEHLNLDITSSIDLKPYAVTDSFNGTLSSTSGYQTNYTEPIYIYAPEDDSQITKLVVMYEDTEKKTSTLYDTTKLEEKDKYALFLSGNHSKINIKTSSTSANKLLIIKDSYANCLVPFLTPYYREIVIIDPRYYYGDIDSIMYQYSFSDVLFLYNCNTFVEDNSISGVLQNTTTE